MLVSYGPGVLEPVFYDKLLVKFLVMFFLHKVLVTHKIGSEFESRMCLGNKPKYIKESL